ncbi:MAG TPA: hypothetical protein VJO35_17780 [Terriglobales bacterium]|nr:hypothetical protein [Terriglobales bacterium]
MRAATAICSAATAALLAGSTVPAQTTAPAPNSTGAKLVEQFKGQAAEYLAWREKTVGSGPPPTDSPEKLDAVRHDLANKIRTARAGAKQGKIFTPQIADYFRRQISATLNGRHGHEVRATLLHAEPVKMDLQVDQSYPPNVPLQSTPPTLLLNLPELPKGLEYRIIDRELVLLDTGPNIVVDYIPDAFPGNTE